MHYSSYKLLKRIGPVMEKRLWGMQENKIPLSYKYSCAKTALKCTVWAKVLYLIGHLPSVFVFLHFQLFYMEMIAVARGCCANLLALWNVLFLTQWAQSRLLSRTLCFISPFPSSCLCLAHSLFPLCNFLLYPSHLAPFLSLQMHYSSSYNTLN